LPAFIFFTQQIFLHWGGGTLARDVAVKITCFLMAGLLNAHFGCYVRVNFDPAFQPAWQTQIRLSTFFPGLEEGISNGT
jgi:hypothetical protein